MRNKGQNYPPHWIDRLLEWFCSDEFLEVVQGDLHEMYHQNVEEQGKKKADRQYLLDVLSLFRPFALGFTLPGLFYPTASGMYKNYLLIALRNFRSQLGFSVINVLGLAIGIAAFMIILTYVSFELSYDKYLENSGDLYRLDMYAYDLDGELFFNAATSSPTFKELMEENMPEVKQVARLYNCSNEKPYINIAYIDKQNDRISFNESHAFYADAAFLDMFDISMLLGDTKAIDMPNTVILSESTAKKYFGYVSEEIIGESLEVSYPDVAQFKITGIYRDIPPNTHLQLDMLMSYKTLSELNTFKYEDHWRFPFMHSYFQLHPNVTEEQFRQKRSQYVKLTNERFQSDDPYSFYFDIDYDRVSNIHLYSDKTGEMKPTGNIQTVYLLLIIGGLVIIIAWVNYVNLATARAAQRAKEVGVRKVAGARRGQLVLQFLSEALVLNLLALLASWLIIFLSLPFFRQLTGKPLSLNFWWEGLPSAFLFYCILAIVFLVSTLLSGFYPAWVLSSFKPLKTLRGRLLLDHSGGISLRSGLVVAQFTMSVILIAGTYAIHQQMEYMQNQPLGFDDEQMLVVKSPTDTILKSKTLEVFKEEMIRQAFVGHVTASSTVPSLEINWANGIRRAEDTAHPLSKYVSIDYDFLDTYNLRISAGRNFSKDFSSDIDAVIINETLAEILGFERPKDALHQKLQVHMFGEKEIIGVIKDYHQSSLKDNFNPTCFFLEGSTKIDLGKTFINGHKHNDRNYISLKINTSRLIENMDWIEAQFKSYFPGYPFQYFFLNERFDQQYKSDLQFANIFSIFAGLAIFIACLGILGLSSFLAVQKSKEIGIRKVLGATVSHIVLLLSGKFVRLVLLSTMVALPLAYYLADQWLENYAFRIKIGWWFFVIPAVAILMIAILTVSVQTIRAAIANPVNSLKHE